MAEIIARVGNITGQAFVRGSDGKMRPIKAGDPVREGETVVAADGSQVKLKMADGREMDVRSGETAKIDASVGGQNKPDATDSALSNAPGELQQINQALAEGGNLDSVLEATAAGASGSAQEGHSFVELLRIVEAVDPLAYQFGAVRGSVQDTIPPGAGLPAAGTTNTPYTNLEQNIGVTAVGTTVVEGNNVLFAVGLSEALSAAKGMTLSLTDGTATLGQDYVTPMQVSFDAGQTWTDVPTSGAITVPAGTISYLVRVPSVADEVNKTLEGTENFTLQVTYNVTGATATTQGGITDDDGPSVTVNVVSDGTLLLTTQDADTAGVSTDSASVDFAAAMLASLTTSYGQDGAGSVSVTGYGLSVVDTASGLTSGGVAIVLGSEGGAVVGRANGVEVFRLAVNGSGQVTLTQSEVIDHAVGSSLAELANGKVTLSATATVTDRDGDTASQTVSVDLGGNVRFEDDVPSVTVNAVVESNLLLTTQDADTTGVSTDSASVDFASAMRLAVSSSYGQDGAGSVSVMGYGLSVVDTASGLMSGGVAIVLGSEGGAVVGRANGVEVFRLTVNGSGQVTLTQSEVIDHAVGSSLAELANGKVTLSATATVTDRDGDTASKPVSVDLGGNVRFEDSSPSPSSSSNVAALPSQDTNILLILDMSGSMLQDQNGVDPGQPGYTGTSRLAIMQQSLLMMLDQYDDLGDIKVRIVTFSDTASANSSGWLDVAAARALIDQAGTIDGRTPSGQTNYDAALITAMSAYADVGKMTYSDVKNVSYFLTDGVPTAASDWDGPGGLRNKFGVQLGEEDLWKGFLNTNKIKSMAYGMGANMADDLSGAVVGNGPDGIPDAKPNLNPIAWDGSTASELNAELVLRPATELPPILRDSIVKPAEGNLSSGSFGIGSAYGVDSHGHLNSLTVDGVTYNYDGSHTSAGSLSSGTVFAVQDVDSTAAVALHKFWTIETAHGGKLVVDLDAGTYTFTTPAANTRYREDVGFTLMDGDGDVSLPATLSIDVLPVTRGRDADDTLTGTADKEYLVGAAGDDTMTGLGNADVFAWRLVDRGVAGNPATDTVTDFSVTEGDKLDLRDLLSGTVVNPLDGNVVISTLQNYLSVEINGANTLLHVKSTGATGAEDQTIQLSNVDLYTATGVNHSGPEADAQAALLRELVRTGTLLVD